MYNLEKIDLTYDRLMKYLTEYEIFAFYIGKNFKIGSVIKNPFRQVDHHPSFSIYTSKEGQLMYKDFSTGESGDCIKFIMKLFNVKYNKALLQIYNEMIERDYHQVMKISIKESKKKSSTKIETKKKYFNQVDLDYWNQFGITKEFLKEYKVSPISNYWINGELSNYKWTKKDPAYELCIYCKTKIYRPLCADKSQKFIGNCTIWDLFGYEQLSPTGDVLIITKSFKDMAVLKLNSYHSVAVQGEGMSIPEEIISDLRNRFKRIIVLYDRDKTGITNARKLVKMYNFDFAFIPKKYKVKDVSDLRKEYGSEETKKVLEKIFS